MKEGYQAKPAKVFLQGIIAIIIVLFTFFSSCKKEYSCENCLPSNNKPPISNAGPDQAVSLPVDSALLDGSASSDPDGSLVYYHWTKIAGPSPVSITGGDHAKVTVKTLQAGIYQFELTVKDNGDLSARDTMNIVVKTPGVKLPPVAKAGTDQSIMLPLDSVLLDGSASTDADGIIVGYSWTKISGPTAFSVASPQSAQTKVKGLTQGIYTFRLTVTDNDGLSSTDDVQVSVTQSTTMPSCANRPVIPVQLQQIGTLSMPGFGLACAASGTKIAFGGGRRQNGYNTRVDIFDVATNSWTIAELSNPYRDGVAAASVGNKILFAGGGENDNGLFTSRVDIFNTATNTWSTAELSQARQSPVAVTIGNKVIIAGGAYWTPYFTGSNKVDIYDNATNTWSTATLSTGRVNLTAAVIGNKAYFAGGYSGGFGPGVTTPASTRVDIYDASTNAWSTTEMQEPRSGHACVAYGNNIYWAGGGSAGVMSNDVEIWNSVTGTSSFSCMIPRISFNAVASGDKLVFFTGFQSDPALLNDKIEIYNASTNTWSTGLLDQPITVSCIISVNNNIYVAGGVANVYSNTPPTNKVWKLVF